MPANQMDGEKMTRREIGLLTAARNRARRRYYITISTRGPSKKILWPVTYMTQEDAEEAIDFKKFRKSKIAEGGRIVGAAVESALLPNKPGTYP